MKKIITTLFLAMLFICTTVIGQNIDPYKVNTAYRQLPSELLPENFQFYSCAVAADPMHLRSLGITESSLTEKINIGGFKKVSTGGNFYIEVIVDPPVEAINYAKIEKKETKKKKEDGTTTTTISYWWQHNLALPVAVRVVDMNGEVLIDRIVRGVDKVDPVVGTSFSTFTKAKEERGKKARSMVVAAHKTAIYNEVKNVNNIINAQYGFPIRKEVVALGVLGAKKHPEYASWQPQMESAKKAFTALTGTGGLESFKTKIKPCEEFWMAQKAATSPDNKKQKKLWYQSTMNLAKSAFWSEDYDNATKYAKEIAATKFKKNSGEQLAKRIEKVKEKMTAIGAKTRYFPIEIGEPTDEVLNIAYAGERQAKIDAYKDRAMGLKEGAVEYPGSITSVDGNELPVTFVIDYNKGINLDFESGGNVKFFREGETTVIREYLDVTKIQAFSFDDRNFRLMEYKPASAIKISIKKKIQKHYLEIVYEADNIAVYHFYPNRQMRNQLGEAMDERVLRKGPQGADLISLAGLKYLNFKKGVSDLFVDCPSLVASIQAGNFKRSDESLKALAMQYQKDCK